MPVVALACALAAPGRADAQLTTELGGSVAFQAGIFDNDKPGEIHRAFRTDVELRLRVLGQMDNGTLYGSEIQLEVPDKTRSVISMDEAYLFIAAKWGRIELGDEDGAMPKMAIHAPSVGLGQLDGDYDQFTTKSIQDLAPPFYAAASEKATKITYYTPRYLGLQVGVSYAPQIDQGQNVVAQRTDPSDFLEGGINYVTEVGDVSLLGGATVVHSRNSGSGTSPGDTFGYQVGGQAGYAGVTIGGGYTNYDGALVASMMGSTSAPVFRTTVSPWESSMPECGPRTAKCSTASAPAYPTSWPQGSSSARTTCTTLLNCQRARCRATSCSWLPA